MDEEQFKAIGFSSGVPVWREILGPANFARVLGELPEETRRLVDHPPLAMSWIRAEVACGFSYTVARLLGARGLELIEEHSKACVERDIRGIYKPLLRIISVDLAMSRAGAIYQQYCRNAGSLRVERTSPGSVVCHYTEIPRVDAVNAAILGGSPLGVLSVIGVKGARVTERVLGDRTVDIRIEWK